MKMVQEVLNALAEYVEERGYPVLNFNDPEVLEESGMDGTDFMDTKHLNAKGARTFSEYFSDFLYETLAADTGSPGPQGRRKDMRAGMKLWRIMRSSTRRLWKPCGSSIRSFRMEFES